MTEDKRVIIAGGGRVGFQTAALLDERGHDVVLIEPDEQKVEMISDAYVATVIQGDATRPSVLEQADPEASDALAALTGRTGSNLAVCMEAEQMTDDIHTVARIDTEDGTEYTTFVDEVIFPEKAGAKAAANHIVGGDVYTFAEKTGDLEIFIVRVAENAPAANKRLVDVSLPEGCMVVSDDEGNHVATADTVLEPRTQYLIASEPDVVDQVLNLFRG